MIVSGFRAILWTAFVAVPLLSLPCLAATQVLVRDGQPCAEIIVAESPARMATFAAKELQHYIEKISGATLPIVTEPSETEVIHIFVGVSKHTEQRGLSDDGLLDGAYVIKTGTDWLALLGRDRDFTPREPYAYNHASIPEMLQKWDRITGATWENPLAGLFKSYSRTLGIWEQDERGSLNAVYDLLRTLGVRWYMPGEWGEHVPHAPSIAVEETDRTVHPQFAMRFMYQYYMMFGFENRDEILWQLRLGLNVGHSVVGSAPIGHGIRMVHGRDETKLAHPEYYALKGGRRVTEGRGESCLSSESLVQANVQFARAAFDIYDAPAISVMPEDGFGSKCQCPLCEGKDTPERGYEGLLSDYVWSYVNRVATELYKTHPDRKVTCFAYTTYTLPPLSIEKFSPNVVVGICQSRSLFGDPQRREKYESLRQQWLAKTDSDKLIAYEYYLHARPAKQWANLPVVYPREIAQDLRSLRGRSYGDFIEVYRQRGQVINLAVNHLNLYVTARLYWDVDQDVDAMLDEYYRLQYGPAASEMKAFFEFAEANWRDMSKSVDLIDKALALLETGRAAAGESIFGKRVDLIMQYTAPMKDLRNRLALGRSESPRYRLTRAQSDDVVIDGRADDEFWSRMQPYALSDLVTGARSHHVTSTRFGMTDKALYFWIRCEDSDAQNLNITATKSGDQSIWEGDNVEVLLETSSHSYYQLVFNPAGAMVDVDRKNGIDTLWSSGAEYACTTDARGWSVELRIPFTNELQAEVDPGNGVAGRMPSPTYPWFFNVCRQRVRDKDIEFSALSPTGKPAFHDLMKFAELTTK